MTDGRNDLSFALLADGTSDRALLRILTWCLRQLDPNVRLLTPHFERRGSEDIEQSVCRLLESYRPHLLFVHRDAERLEWAERRREIPVLEQLVPVIPVRMTEAWLLTDESAIRRASGNPNGKVRLDLPPVSRLEALPDPKAELHRLLRVASELTGRRLKRLNEGSAVHRVAEYTESFHQLRELSAFVALEDELRRVYPTVRRGG